MQEISKEGRGVIVLIREPSTIMLTEQRRRAGEDIEMSSGELRDYGVGAQILRYLGITQLRLMSNNPRKRAGLLGYGLEIVETVPIRIAPNPHNERYLQTKRDRLGHEILK